MIIYQIEIWFDDDRVETEIIYVEGKEKVCKFVTNCIACALRIKGHSVTKNVDCNYQYNIVRVKLNVK